MGEGEGEGEGGRGEEAKEEPPVTAGSSRDFSVLSSSGTQSKLEGEDRWELEGRVGTVAMATSGKGRSPVCFKVMKTVST